MLYEWLAPWKLWGVVVFAPTAGWIRDCWKNQHRYHKYLDPYKHKQQQYMGNRWFKCCITKALPEFFDDSKYTKTTDEAFLWVARVARDAGPFRLEWWVRRVCHWAQSGWYLRWWSRKSATFIYTGERVKYSEEVFRPIGFFQWPIDFQNGPLIFNWRGPGPIEKNLSQSLYLN